MLAPSVRVCVACNQLIDVTQIKRPLSGADAIRRVAAHRALAPVRFSWSTFFLAVGLWCLAAIAVQRFVGPVKGQYVMGGTVILSSAWLFYDAHVRGVPKPLRWGVASLLLWIVFFPWYLARRRTPEAPCPFVEGEVRPFLLVLLLILMVFLLVSAVLFILNAPAR